MWTLTFYWFQDGCIIFWLPRSVIRPCLWILKFDWYLKCYGKGASVIILCKFKHQCLRVDFARLNHYITSFAVEHVFKCVFCLYCLVVERFYTCTFAFHLFVSCYSTKMGQLRNIEVTQFYFLLVFAGKFFFFISTVCEIWSSLLYCKDMTHLWIYIERIFMETDESAVSHGRKLC